MALTDKKKKSAPVTFPRRLFIALCLAAIAVLAYYLFYHEPSREKIDYYNNELANARDSFAQKNIERKNETRRASLLEKENTLLQDQINALSNNVHVSEDDVKMSISAALERCGFLDLSFDNVVDMKRGQAQAPENNKANFRIQGSFQDVLDFLDAMPGLKGLPHAWKLEFLEHKDCLDLWMEMEYKS